jgi:hypothetical protein
MIEAAAQSTRDLVAFVGPGTETSSKPVDATKVEAP